MSLHDWSLMDLRQKMADFPTGVPHLLGTPNTECPHRTLKIFHPPATTIHRTFEINASFHLKQRTTGKVQFLFFGSFLLVLTKFSFWEEDWALGYNSMKIWDFPDISKFPKILSLQSFGNL